MMRETEVHKFIDGTLRRILEKLDYMVKDYELYKYNPGMENRIWNEDDKQRRQEFIKLIERRLKIRRIFRSLESFDIGNHNTMEDIWPNPISDHHLVIFHRLVVLCLADRHAHTFLDLENLNTLFLKFFNFNTWPLQERRVISEL
ncbi:hypothetical protein Tco_1313888 [Tanacetum coccineum]